MLWITPLALQKPANSFDVNWLPWSLCRTIPAPEFPFSALFSVSIASCAVMLLPHHARHNATVNQVNNRTVIPQHTVCQRQVSKVGTPNPVRLSGCEILLQKVWKYLVWCAFLVDGSLSSDYGEKLQFSIHIFIDSCFADEDVFFFKKEPHLTVTRNSTIFVIQSLCNSLQAKNKCKIN